MSLFVSIGGISMDENQSPKRVDFFTVSEAIIKYIVILSLTGAFIWSFITGDLVKSFTDTSVPILLAFFAMGLSAAFFFKDSDASNKFYDRSYNFTNQITEILTEMKATQNEKLNYLENNHCKTHSKLDLLSGAIKNINDTTALVKETNISLPDKERIMLMLNETNSELLKGYRDIRLSHPIISDIDSLISVLQFDYKYLQPSDEDLTRLLDSIKHYFQPVLNHELRKLGWIDDDFNFTDKGLQCIKDRCRACNLTVHNK